MVFWLLAVLDRVERGKVPGGPGVHKFEGVSVTDVDKIVFHNGVEIPQIGLGVWQVDKGETQRVVEDALAAGYRHIDTAAAYGNEAGVGAALRAAGLPRSEVFVTTKLRNGEQGYDSALKAYQDSLERMGLDFADMYMIHWPTPAKDLYVETWGAFEKLYEEGAVRAIGVANFLPDHLERLLGETEVKPVVNQFELHPTYQQAGVEEATRYSGLAVQAYSPIGRGEDIKKPTVVSIADRVGVSPSQVVLAWHLHHGRIIIPKSTNAGRMAENLSSASVVLSDEDIAQIDGLEEGNMQVGDPATLNVSQMRS